MAQSLYKSISQSDNMHLLINWYIIKQKAVITLRASKHIPAGQNSASEYMRELPSNCFMFLKQLDEPSVKIPSGKTPCYPRAYTEGLFHVFQSNGRSVDLSVMSLLCAGSET